MDLTVPERVRIDALLLAREEQFVRVHACESAIEEILGAAYPFPPPPPLPSTQKRRSPRKKAARTSGETQTAQQAPQLSPLGPGEVAYRLTYVQDGLQSTEDFLSAAPLERWLRRPSSGMEHIRVETIDANGMILRRMW